MLPCAGYTHDASQAAMSMNSALPNKLSRKLTAGIANVDMIHGLLRMKGIARFEYRLAALSTASHNLVVMDHSVDVHLRAEALVCCSR